MKLFKLNCWVIIEQPDQVWFALFNTLPKQLRHTVVGGNLLFTIDTVEVCFCNPGSEGLLIAVYCLQMV